MASVAAKYFSNEIEQLTKIMRETQLTDDLVLKAKSQELDEMKRKIESFFANHSEECYRIIEFFLDYESEKWPIVFYKNKTNNYAKYDRAKIRGIDLVCLCALSDEVVSTQNLFYNIELLQETLRSEGYEQIADYIQKEEINSLESLIKAFKEK